MPEKKHHLTLDTFVDLTPVASEVISGDEKRFKGIGIFSFGGPYTKTQPLNVL